MTGLSIELSFKIQTLHPSLNSGGSWSQFDIFAGFTLYTDCVL